MGGRVGQANGGPGTGATEDGGRRQQNVGGDKEDERAGRRRTTTVGEMGGRAGRGEGEPLAAADLPIWPARPAADRHRSCQG